MKGMTLKDLDSLRLQDFENPAAIESIRVALKEREQMRKAIEGMLQISSLWIPLHVAKEHADEAAALHIARQQMLDCIEQQCRQCGKTIKKNDTYDTVPYGIICKSCSDLQTQMNAVPY